MAAGAVRTYGLGATLTGPTVSARRGIEPADISFALEKRAQGWGWQTIAKVRTVNREDLQRACEARTNPPIAGPAAKAKPKPRITNPLRLLKVVSDGVQGRLALADAVGFSPDSVDVYLSVLRRDGMIVGFALRGGLKVTERGWKALRDAGLADG